MAQRQWTRAQLMELARGRQVTARNLQANDVDPPAWLLNHADGRFPYDSSQSLELVHPDDRAALVESFLTSAMNPAEPVTVRLRSRSGGRWHHGETVWLNLLGDDDVGVILAFVRDVDGPPIEAPEDDSVGAHAATRWMVWTLSDTGFITSVEGASLEVLGYQPHELVGRHPVDFLPPDTVPDSIAMWVDLHRRPGNTATNRRHWTRRDGSRIWIEDSYLNRADRDGDDSVLVVLWDATDRMAQEHALRHRETELVAREAEKSALAAQMQDLAAQMQALAGDFRLLADEVPAAVFRCDPSGVVLFHNARWTELIGEQEGVTRLHDIFAQADHAGLDHLLTDLVNLDSADRRSLEVTGDDGRRTWRVSLRGTGDGGNSLIGSIEDVSATVELRREARHDALTGLPNRVELEEHLSHWLLGDPANIVVLFVDLDGFKQVNDTWGHDAGDVVLKEVSRRLRAGMRPDDIIGRQGGDEFVIICDDARTASPPAIMNRLTIALGGDITFPGGTWQPAASIGWARGQPGDDTASILRRADFEMFERKRDRSNRRGAPT